MVVRRVDGRRTSRKPNASDAATFAGFALPLKRSVLEHPTLPPLAFLASLAPSGPLEFDSAEVGVVEAPNAGTSLRSKEI
jgi:hypothetical protein